MNRFICSFLLMACFFTAQSQRVYFVYLQTENDQAFFVKMNEKIYSSAASGYLVLPKLRDSVYTFSVGFPGGKWPEQRFSVEVKGKDHGYLVKNFAEKGWGLFDLQTMAVQMSASQPGAKTELKEASVFTDVLSKASNDPSLKERAVQVKSEENPVAVVQQAALVVKEEPAAVKKEEPKKTIVDTEVPVTQEEPTMIKEEPKATKEEPKPEQKIEPPLVVKEAPVKQETAAPVKDEAAVNNVYKKSVVSRKSESSTTEGFGLTFVDEYDGGKKDTIKIVIPNPKQAFTEKKETPKKEDDMAAMIPPVAKNAACPAVAAEADFLKLRKKMAAGKDNEGMINEAKKGYKTKCYTTAQVKNLGNLFLDDAGKYQFFDASYAHIADPENFPSLQAELKEAYFVNRFKALLK